MLTQEDKDRLLKIARESIKVYLSEKKSSQFKESSPELNQLQGAFVTLKKKSELRGCIGRIQADRPLYETVSLMAIQAATEDPRFSSLSLDELDEIKIEISVLSPLKKIDNINEIEVGKHGILIRKEHSSGLLLPQVAIEYNLNREEFLENTCYKAGLDKKAWKDKSTQIYIFSAEAFSESNPKLHKTSKRGL